MLFPLVLLSLNVLICPTPVRAESIKDGLAGEAYVLAERWVSRATVPQKTSPIKVNDVIAIHATVRLDGITLGQATAASNRPRQPIKGDIDISPVLIAAVREALTDAQSQLVKIAGQPNAPKLPGRIEKVAPLLVLDLQFASPISRVQVNNPRELTEQFVMGIHGIAAQRDENWAWIFPATALSANLSLQTQITRVLSQLQLGAEQFVTAGQPEGLPLYRFETLHLVRANLDAPLAILQRGRPVRPIASPTLDEIQLQSHRWADHLIGRLDDHAQFKGTYQPTADRYQPPIASPADSALACLALARYIQLEPPNSPRQVALAPVVKQAIIQSARDAALLPPAPDGPPPDTSIVDCADTAMVLLAMLAAPDMEDHKDLRDKCGSALVAAQDARGAFRIRPHARATAAPRPAQALMSYALVELYDRTRDPRYLTAARRGLVNLWQNTPEQRVIGTMPWAALAEFGLLQRGMSSPGLLIVRQACDAIWKLQVKPPTHADPASPNSPGYIPPDTVGGFDLKTSLIDEPTWQSAAMLFTLGAALPVKSFMADDLKPRWVVDGTAGLGFLHRLSLDTDTMWYVHQPRRARHGVRTAIWDNRQPLAATAMALLASAQWQQSLKQLENKP